MLLIVGAQRTLVERSFSPRLETLGRPYPGIARAGSFGRLDLDRGELVWQLHSLRVTWEEASPGNRKGCNHGGYE
jgi:hypothetical protein